MQIKRIRRMAALAAGLVLAAGVLVSGKTKIKKPRKRRR